MGPWIGVLLLFLPLLPSAQINTPSQPEATPILELTPTSSASNTSNITETEPSPSLIPTLTAKPSSEDDWSAAENYLYTADSSSLAASTCTRTFQLPVQRGSPPPVLPALLQQAVASLTNAANFLNLIFQASELREMSVREDIEWYHALVRALLEGDRPGLVRRAYLTFDADPTIQQPQLVLHASKGSTQDILLQDLTSSWSSFLPPAPDQSWFNRFKSSSPPLNALFKRVLLNDLSTLDTPKWARGDSYVFNSSGVQWGDGPFLECVNGRFMPGWLLSLSMPFYGLKPDLSPEFRGVIRVDVNIQGFPVDQCASGDFWFANTHQCNRTSMECESSLQQGFRMGQYCCRCKKGFYSPVPRKTSKRKTKMNSTRACYPELPVCLPCWPGCVQCRDGNPCWVQEDWLLRSGVLAVQGLFMVLVLISMLAAYQCRRTKRIRSSGLLLLEMILCGSLLLYFPVFILYFKPSTFRCILLRWVRLLGFAVVYGTVTLKIYRVLKVFLSRTAQRVPYITTTGVLRMLGVMVLTVSWFLCAWTVGVLQNRDRNVPLLIVSTTSEGQGFRVCDLDRWDYMMAVAEMLFLCWGIFLCSAVKTVPSAFHEPRYMSIAIHNELLLSSLFHLLRFFRPSIHPDWMLMLFFIHTHVTITVTLGLLFIPKFLHISRPGQEEIAAEVYEDEVDLRRSCSYLNSSFTSNCWSDQSLDPDDIRDELKKLYSQLEVNKTKRMANSNPHLPKKRSSRLSIGRSIIKRITEIPESLSRQCSREDKDISAAIGTITRTASYYKSHPSASINTVNESLMQPSPKLRKSHSAYDCGPETDPATLLNSSIRGTEKRSSQISDAGSINTTLLICKSASAQNLSLDTNFLLPEPSRFQKSLSVIERNGHRSVTRSTENVTFSSKTFPAEKVQQNVDADIKRQTSSALLSESFDKAEVCPWEVPDEPANKNQKHVTYASSKEEEPKSPSPATSPSLLYVCPWEYLPPPTVPTKESAQSDGDSTKPKASISSSAPGSPHVISEKPKEFRVFSFRSATQKLVAAKRMSEVGRTLSRERSINDDQVKQTTLQKSHSASVRLTPESAASDKRTPQPQRRAMTTIGTKPSLVKQIAVRLPSTESPERSPKHTAPVHICPWESEEVVIEVRKQSVNESLIQKQILQSSTLLAVPNPDVCPWDVPKPFHQTSVSEVCPWDVVEAEEVPSKSTRSDVCPWETDPNLGNSAVVVPVLGDAQKQTDVLNTNSPQIKQEHSKFLSDTSKPFEKELNPNLKQDDTDFPAPPPPVIDISPWKSDSKDSLAEKAHICPWETEDSESSEAFKSATYRKPAGQHERVYANVGLWNAGEPEKPFQRAQEARVNVCPWETTGEPSGTVERTSVQPLETKQSMGTLQKQDSGRANVCPWETEEPTKPLQKQDSGRANVCPWETEEPTKPLQKQDSDRANVCPWETEEPTKTLQKQDSGRANVCPWETEEPTKTLQKQDSGRANVCPWETEEPTKTLQKQDSVRADVCPWETEEPTKTSQKQDSGRTNVCPWETEEPTKTLQKQDSVRADVCPWETEESTKSLQKQDSVRTNVCPWEAEEPKHILQKQDSVRANVCPWETEEPTKPLQKQDSIHADVCPWETEEQRNTLQTDGGSANVCPWEKQAPNTLPSKRSSNADVGPWETSEPIKTLQKQASVHSDICPWESNTSPKPSTPKRQDSGPERGDITPTHHSDPIIRTPEVNRVSLPLVRCDALCPWEMEGCRQDSVTRSNSDVFTWEETIPEEDDDAETAAEAFVFPSDL